MCGKSTLQGRTLWWRFLLPFGNLGFRIFRGSPLPSPKREKVRFFSLVILLTEALIPSVGIGSDGGPLSLSLFPLYLPLRAPGKVLARASFPVPDYPNPQEGVPNTESSSPLLASPGQRAISQNDVTINERRCVRLEDYLLGRRCGCCSGPRPR